MENGIVLRLYRQCKISPTYKNVLSRTQINSDLQNWNSPFDEYLNSLNHYDIELDEVYQDDNTEFNFYLSTQDYSSIYNFNYMRIQSIKDNVVVLERFAFISSLKIKNDIAILKYKIDVWHSFIKNLVGINYGYLRGYRIIKNSPSSQLPTFDIYNLPLDYAGNNKVSITSLVNYTRLTQVALIVEIQEYDASEIGKSNWAWTRYAFITNYKTKREITEGGTTTYVWDSFHLNIENVEYEIQNILSSSMHQSFNNGDKKNYFKIGKIYILPYSSELASLFDNEDEDIYIATTHTESILEIITFERRYYVRSSKQFNNLVSIENSSINNDFKLRTIGFYSKQFDIELNGTSITYSITAISNYGSFGLYLNYQNKIVDVKDYFEYLPVSSQIDGTQMTQLRMNKLLNNFQNSMALANWSVNTAVGLYTGGMNLSKLNTQMSANESLINQSLNLGNGFRTTNYANMYEQSAYNYGIAQAGLVQDSGNMLTGAYSIAMKRAVFNAPQYNYHTIINANNIALLNCYYWISKCVINSDNDAFVKQLINYTGFEVYKFVSGIMHTGLLVEGHMFTDNNIYYNVLQYKIVDCYGEFPMNIKTEIDKILLNGVRIYYSGAHFMENDTYLEDNNLA